MKTKFFLTIISLACLLLAACGYLDGGGLTGVNNVFADLENGIRKADEDLFKKHWTAEGYNQNLVGKSGLSGARVFEQGSRKKWFLKPDYSKTVKQGNVEIYQCEVYAWEKSKAVDEIFLAISTKDGKVLGGGEDLSEVKNLADRFNSGDSLELPK
jgi:hypothetical protein